MNLAVTEALALGGGLGAYFGFGAYFEWIYYRRKRDRASEWKIQPTKFTPAARRRDEIVCSTFNLTMASLLSGYLAYRIGTDNPTQVYLNRETHGIAFGVLMTVLYFLFTDLGLYLAHRLMHRPALFRAIHRWHHRTLSPTAFTASAMHPLEFLVYQTVAAAPLFLVPIPALGIAATLMFHNVVALFDHSGIDYPAWFPWQPPPRFHDDHHAFFHVNYGQTLGAWDRMFGTWRREGRVYGEEIFGGRGAPGENATMEPRYKDYRREATRR